MRASYGPFLTSFFARPRGQVGIWIIFFVFFRLFFFKKNRVIILGGLPWLEFASWGLQLPKGAALTLEGGCCLFVVFFCFCFNGFACDSLQVCVCRVCV